MLTYESIGKGGFRLTSDTGRESLLSRYGILKNTLARTYSESATLKISGNTAVLGGARRDVLITVEEHSCGFAVSIPLRKGERLFGLGDATRDAVMVRGLKVPVHVCNVGIFAAGEIPVFSGHRPNRPKDLTKKRNCNCSSVFCFVTRGGGLIP